MTDNRYLNEIQRIVQSGLCHRCGSCSGICPEAVIVPGDDYYPAYKDKEKCISCGLCVAVCPGREFSFPEYWRRLFGISTEPAAGGVILKAFLAHAVDTKLRANSTSGGIATQLPIFLLKRRLVRGAIVVKSDPACPWKPVAVVARTESEIKEGMLSKYPACSLNHLFRELRTERGPFVVTGLPCHIHGLHKMIAMNPSIADKIALMIGLFCHSCLDHAAIHDILDYYHIDSNNLVSLQYRYDKIWMRMQCKGKNEQNMLLPFPWLGVNSQWRPPIRKFLTFLFYLYSPLRCRMCIDGLAEFADISIGDPWLRHYQALLPTWHRGYNLVFARTVRGMSVLEEAEKAGDIILKDCSSVLSLSFLIPQMADEKKIRSFYYIEQRVKHDKAVPDYSFHILTSKLKKVKASVQNFKYLVADSVWLRRILLKLFLSPVGFIIFNIILVKDKIKIQIAKKYLRNTINTISRITGDSTE